MIRPQYTTLPTAPHIDFNTPSTLVVNKAYVQNVMKSDLNVSDDDTQDTVYSYLEDLIKTATQDSEKATMRAYINRDITVNWKYVYKELTLPVAGYNSITSITATDPHTGVTEAITSDYYTVIENGEYVNVIFNYIQNRSIKIVYNAGYGADDTSVPTWVRDVVSRRVKYLYSDRPEDMVMSERRYTMVEMQNVFIYYNDFVNFDKYNIDDIYPTTY